MINKKNILQTLKLVYTYTAPKIIKKRQCYPKRKTISTIISCIVWAIIFAFSQEVHSQNGNDYENVKSRMHQLIGEWTMSGTKFGNTPFCFRIQKRDFDNEIEIKVPAAIDKATGNVLRWQEGILFANLNCFNNATYGYEIAGTNTRRRSSYGISYRLSNGGYDWGVVQIVFSYDGIQSDMIKVYVKTADGHLEDVKKDLGIVDFIRYQDPFQNISLYSDYEDIKKLANSVCIETFMNHGFSRSSAEKNAKILENGMLEFVLDLRAFNEAEADVLTKETIFGMFSTEEILDHNSNSIDLKKYFHDYVEEAIKKLK